MKKRFLFSILIALIAIPAYAELTVKDAISPDYLNNHGYSPATIHAINKNVASANGEPLEEPVEKQYYKNPCVNFVRRVFMYLDPALDSHTFSNDYKINPTVRFDDLNSK